MSFTAVVENDTIKLPNGMHLPNGTQVTVQPAAPRLPMNAPRGPMRHVPDFVARQRAIGMTEMFTKEEAEYLDRWLRGETD